LLLYAVDGALSNVLTPAFLDVTPLPDATAHIRARLIEPIRPHLGQPRRTQQYQPT